MGQERFVDLERELVSDVVACPSCGTDDELRQFFQQVQQGYRRAADMGEACSCSA